MKRFATRALYATLFTGGLLLLGAGVAHASETSGDDGILSGTQLGISIELPVTVSGNSVSVIGDSESSDAWTQVSTDTAEPASSPVAVTSGEDGIGSGSQAIVDVSAPVTVSGNAVSVVGDSSSSDAATAVWSGGDAGGTDAWTSGEDSILGGTQAIANVSAPVTVGGNAVSVIGDSSSEGATTVVHTGSNGDGGDAWTSGEDSILGGTQAVLDVVAPVTIGGNAVSVIGDSSSEGATTVAHTGSGHGTDAWTSGQDSILGGTQAIADVSAPVTIGGNAVSVIGDSSSEGATTVVHTGSGSGTDAWTSGEDSILGGTQILPDLSLPVTIGGNAVSVIGDSSAGGSTTVVNPVDPTDPTDPVDPTDPTDPIDPTDPTEPTTPGTPGDGGHSGSTVTTGSGATVASSGAAKAATPGSLASTGLDAGFWERLALFLLLTGAVLVGLRRFAFRR